MKKLGLIIAALALVLGMSQCTKKPNMPTFGGGKTTPKEIAFSVNGNGGQKGDFDQVAAALDYTWRNGDKIYVYSSNNALVDDNKTDFSSGHYCGVLNLIDGANTKTAKFHGIINIPESTNTLRFVHFGTGVTLEGDEATGYSGSVSFATQNGALKGENSISSKVIALCDKEYDENLSEYNAGNLTVQFAVVRFSFENIDGTNVIMIGGDCKTNLTVGSNGACECSGKASVTLNGASGNDKYYTVLLPTSGSKKRTFGFKGNEKFAYKRAIIEAGKLYSENYGENPSGNSIVLVHSEDVVHGLFTVDSDGDQVLISNGNIQYLGKSDGTGTWRFAEHQYDYMGDGPATGTERQGNVDLGEAYTGKYNTGSGIAGPDETEADKAAARDLFGWGTTGYKDTRANTYQTNYQPYSTTKTPVGNTDPAYNINMYGYGPDFDATNLYGLSVTTKSDWGMHFNTDVENSSNTGWRTMTGGAGREWDYLFTCRTTDVEINGVENARYSMITVNGVKGILIYPDCEFVWNTTTMGAVPVNVNPNGGEFAYSNYTISQFQAMENCGVVFLPAAGIRTGPYFPHVNEIGYYWSSSCGESAELDGYSACAYRIGFHSGNIVFDYADRRCYGKSVRLVR